MEVPSEIVTPMPSTDNIATSAAILLGELAPGLSDAVCTSLRASGHSVVTSTNVDIAGKVTQLSPAVAIVNLDPLGAAALEFVIALRNPASAAPTVLIVQTDLAIAPVQAASGSVYVVHGQSAHELTVQAGLILLARENERQLKALERDHAALSMQFEQLSATSLDAVCAFDAAGAFVQVSPACERIWGYTGQEMLGLNFFSLATPEDRPRVVSAAGAVRNGAQTIRFESWQHDKSGKVIFLMCSLSWSASLQVFSCTARDESDSAHAASQLIISEQHYQSLFDHNPDAVYSFDLQANFVSLNSGAERLGGYSRSELIATPLISLIASEYKKTTIEHFLRAVAGEGVTYLTALIHHSGAQVHLNVTNLPIVVRGAVVGVFGIAKNITDQINAVELKRVSEERFSNVARATTDTIWDWDIASDMIWWNDGLQTVFGYSASDIEPDSRSWVDRIHNDDITRVLHGIHLVIDGSENSWTDEYRFRRRDGSHAWVVDRGFVIRDSGGKALRMVGGMSDVTARRQSEQMLGQLNRALRMLSACNKVLIRARSEQELLDEICRIAREFGGYRVAWVGYAENDIACSIKPVAQAGIDAATLAAVRISWSEAYPAGRGPSGRTIRSGEPSLLQDVTEDPAFAEWMQHAEALGLGAIVSLPLRNGGKTFGVLTLHLSEARPVPDEEMALLRELADNLAFGIETRRVEEERRRLQSTVEKVASAVSVSVGTSTHDFFDQLVRNMADAVGAQGAFVARLCSDNRACVETIAGVIDGTTVPAFTYALAGMPCEQVIDEGECVVKNNVTDLLPDESRQMASDMHAYVGRRLDNPKGEPFGLVYVLFRERIERVDHILSTLRIFGARVSAEMDRHISDLHMRDQAALLDHATDAIVVRSMDGAVTFWNKGAERLYGWTRAEAQGHPMLTRTAAESHDLQEILDRTVRDGEWRGELLQRRNDGNAVAVEARWTLIRNEHGAPLSILAIETDITQRKSAEHEIEHLAFYDRLTDLPNRLLLRNRLQHAMETNERSGRMGALLWVDLDNFKALNDSLGHDTGDVLLQLVAVRLSYCLRASDTVARLGGDEFIILLVDLGDYASEAASRGKMVAEKVLQAFVEPFLLGDSEGHATPSIGITLFGAATDSIDELLQRAELAMYQAKAAGRNTMQFFDPDMQAVVTARVTLEAEIRAGLKLDQFLLHYQPQVDATGLPTGAEALVRWRHPLRGLVPPGAFIPVAEETGLILPLGSWVMETACHQLAAWAVDPTLADLTIAVNVSARQFRQSAFVNDVLDILQRTGANPRRLKLELTESLLIDSVEDTVLKMVQLKNRGVGFSLDDFGIGYSSLSYLKRLPLDQLKIDQSFVRDILTDPNDEAIARTIVALGNSLGLAVIAEGVETAEQKSRLATLGCFFYQGYHFSRPIPVADFMAFVRNPSPIGT